MATRQGTLRIQVGPTSVTWPGPISRTPIRKLMMTAPSAAVTAMMRRRSHQDSVRGLRTLAGGLGAGASVGPGAWPGAWGHIWISEARGHGGLPTGSVTPTTPGGPAYAATS